MLDAFNLEVFKSVVVGLESFVEVLSDAEVVVDEGEHEDRICSPLVLDEVETGKAVWIDEEIVSDGLARVMGEPIVMVEE